MTEIIIGEVNGHTLIVRDRDGDGIYEPAQPGEPVQQGDQIGLRLQNGRTTFAERRVTPDLQSAGLGPSPSGRVRIAAMGNYVDLIRQARTAADAGDIAEVGDLLHNAENANENDRLGAPATYRTELRWRAIRNYVDQHYGAAEQMQHFVEVLSEDANPVDNDQSSRFFLGYLSSNGTPHGLQPPLTTRFQRLAVIRARGGKRSTDEPQTSSNNIMFHVGDRVFPTDEAGAPAMTIRRFELRAGATIAHFSNGDHADINELEREPERPPPPPPEDNDQAEPPGNTWVSAIRSIIPAPLQWLMGMGNR